MQEEQLKKISLQKYKLCFQVTYTDISVTHQLSPVCSRVIHDTKNAKNLSISKYDPKSCRVDGTEELVMHTGRLPKGRREKRSIPTDEPQGGKRRKVTSSDKALDDQSPLPQVQTVYRAVSTICQTATPDINVSQTTNERFTSGQLDKYVPIQPRPATSVQPASSIQLILIPPHKNTQQVTPSQVCHLSHISPTVGLRSQQQQSSMNSQPTLSAPLQLIQAGVDNSVYNSSSVTEDQHNMTAAASVTSVTSQISQGLYSGSSSSIQDSSLALSSDEHVLLNDISEWGSEVGYISMGPEATTDVSEVDYISMGPEATTDDSEVDYISMGPEATTDDSEVDYISMGMEATTDDNITDECIKFFEDDLDALFTDEETS